MYLHSNGDEQSFGYKFDAVTAVGAVTNTGAVLITNEDSELVGSNWIG